MRSKLLHPPIISLIPQFLILFSRRARRKRGDDDDDDDEDGGDEDELKDSDVEMEDAQAASSSRKAQMRKSDASEEGVPKQSRADRLSARTQAKVCIFKDTFY